MVQYKVFQQDIEDWLAQAIEADGAKYHGVYGDAPYFLGEIVKRFGSKSAAPAQGGKDGAFKRLSKGFMGQTWDGFESEEAFETWVYRWASGLLKVVYPNALGLFHGGTRTYDMVAHGLRRAGWEILDTIIWMHAGGVPLGYNVSKHFRRLRRGGAVPALTNEAMQIPLAQRAYWHQLEKTFAGYRPSLKPMWEPIIVARAPRGKETMPHCAEHYGTGLFDIDNNRLMGSWVFGTQTDIRGNGYNSHRPSDGHIYARNVKSHADGRYPPNMIASHHPMCNGKCHPDCPTLLVDEASGYLPKNSPVKGTEPHPQNQVYNQGFERKAWDGYGDSGGASRLIYTPKAPKWEKVAGLSEKQVQKLHPTHKPIQMTQQICSLLLPPSSVAERRLLIPFSGVGSEMIGALLSGFEIVHGIEQDPDYVKSCYARLNWWNSKAGYADAAQQFKNEKKGAVQIALPW